MDKHLFWLVWNPQGVRPPSHKHYSAEDAGREAARLAAQSPGESFYVLQAVEARRTADAPVETIALTPREPDDDECPF